MFLSVKYWFSAKLHVLSAFRPDLLKSKIWCGRLLEKEVKTMKNGKMMAAKIAKSVAEKALKRDANQTTCTIFYQPKMPAGLKQFKKNKAWFLGFRASSLRHCISRKLLRRQTKNYISTDSLFCCRRDYSFWFLQSLVVCLKFYGRASCFILCSRPFAAMQVDSMHQKKVCVHVARLWHSFLHH